MKLIFKLLLIILSAVLFNSCNTTDPPTPPETKATLTLALEDTSCTEVWLQLKTKDLTLPAELTLKQYNQTGDSLSQNFVLNTQDSILYIDSLLPNQNYFFQVSSIKVSSIKQQVTTMDTTSHNYTFQSWTFGTIGGSGISDVAIINENDIWAVGEILIADSVGTGYTVYNAVHWDGQSWELKKIQTLYLGNWITLPLEGIFAFSSTDIWLAGSLPIHGDGTNWTIYDIRETSGDPYLDVSRLWGSNPNDIYFVGRHGSIVHYNGSSFSKIESGTTISFQEVFGARNTKTGNLEIMTICSRNYPLEKAIYKIEDNTVIKISSDPIEWELYSCWFVSGKHYYVVGSGLYEKNNLKESNWRNDPLQFTTHSTNKIRGTGLNDIFCVGSFGEILHFNGYRWKSFIPELGTIEGEYFAVDFKDNIVVAAGYEVIKAKITIGHRN